MVTVSSNINYYTNLFAKTINPMQAEDKALKNDQNKTTNTQESDIFEKSVTNQNNTYSNNIQSKPMHSNQNEINSTNQLTPAEKKEVEKLSKTDQKVRAHEQAHLAAGAGLVRGGASFEYTRGPDGKMYAVGGEVKIDISPISGKPDETIRKMERVIAAALAPVDPSPQDRAVATIARNIQAKAQMEKSEEIRKNSQPKTATETQTKENKKENQIEPIQTEETNVQKKDSNMQNSNSIVKQRIIKQYIINNPYQKLDRILLKTF